MKHTLNSLPHFISMFNMNALFRVSSRLIEDNSKTLFSSRKQNSLLSRGEGIPLNLNNRAIAREHAVAVMEVFTLLPILRKERKIV
jgi:hypothetical protein